MRVRLFVGLYELGTSCLCTFPLVNEESPELVCLMFVRISCGCGEARRFCGCQVKSVEMSALFHCWNCLMQDRDNRLHVNWSTLVTMKVVVLDSESVYCSLTYIGTCPFRTFTFYSLIKLVRHACPLPILWSTSLRK
jgi:hypothetical protein